MAPSLRSFRPWDLCIYHSAKTQEALFRGDLNQTLIHIELATKLRIEAEYTILKGWCHIQNAQVMHELGRHREAAEHLTHAFDFAREVRGKSTEYAALLSRALFAFDQGKEEAGLFSLRKAFALGLLKIDSGKMTGTMYSKYMDPSGDFFVVEISLIGLERDWKYLSGTGKWKGVTGGGKAVPSTKPGTSQGCVWIRGTYELKK